MKAYKIFKVLPLLVAFIGCTNNINIDEKWQTLVIGSYTDSGAKGIVSCRFNQEDGTFEMLDSISTSNPSYLAFSESGDYLYAANENDIENSAISSFKFDKVTGKLSYINSVATESSAPCYINIYKNRAITANYFGGDISIVGIDTTTGTLTELISKQIYSQEDNPSISHLHTAYTTPNRKHIIATDLGKDRLYVYNAEDILNADPGAAIPYSSYSMTKGAGPRHMDISKDGIYIYVLGELGGEITTFECTNGELKEVSIIVADSLNASGSADIHLSSDGRDIYATNRLKGDGIVHFRIKNGGRELERVSYNPTGRHPRNFVISPNDKYILVASRDDNRVDIFERNIKTGILTATGSSIVLHKPVCLKFVP